MSGTGVAASPIANLSPASLTFGTLAVGATSGPQPITLRNLGSAALTLSQLTFTGSDAASFAIAPVGTTCPIGSTVAIGAICIVQIDFRSTNERRQKCHRQFHRQCLRQPSIHLTVRHGHRTYAADFSRLVDFRSSKRRYAESITNDYAFQHRHQLRNHHRDSPLQAPTQRLQREWIIVAVLGAGASCQLIVIFKPVAAGNRSASISISDNAVGNPHSVPVAGTATQAAVSISPATVTFANQLVGTASPPVPITATNTGTGALVIASISFSGANAADFTQKNTCTAPVAPAATCLINVTFAPTAVGARTASMTIADNASNAPQSVPLTATAMNFAIDPPNVGATSATITAGQTATYQLNLQSIDGFAGPVTLTCSGAPAGATCTVIPTPITLAANATAPFQVQVSTTARPATTSLLPLQTPLGPQTPSHSLTATPSFQQPRILPGTNSKIQRRRPAEVSFILLVLIALITALIATSIAIRIATARITNRYPKVTTARRTRNHQNFSKHVNPSLATATTLAIALTITAVSCGTPHPTTQTSSTPPGTYILTLTSTAPPASSPPTLSLTLTVQ